MSLYSVYVRNAAAPTAVRDGFSWFAFLLPPVYALVHGLWVLLFGWLVGVIVLGAARLWIGPEAAFWIYWLATLLVGFEAATLRRGKLRRGGWDFAGDLVATGGEDVALRDYLRSK